jgi:hypothetical protein
MKSRLFQVFASLSIVVFFVCGQQALAQESRHHLQARIASAPHQGEARNAAKFDELFQLASGFGVLPPVDSGGNDEWPCFPNANANGADCSQIATGGVVLGTPAYTQSLANCDADSSSSTSCGQIFWFYEDDTGDNTDPLIVSIEVKQGTKVILDTGKIPLASPNPFPAGSVIIISDDVAFGTLGETGKGNGFCAGTKVVCVNPVAGIATVTLTTTVGQSKITSHFNINLQ